MIGEACANPSVHHLPVLHVTVTKNGTPLSEGYGAAVQDSPAEAVAWLANTLGTYGVTLNTGDIFEMELHGIGRCVARFV